MTSADLLMTDLMMTDMKGQRNEGACWVCGCTVGVLMGPLGKMGKRGEQPVWRAAGGDTGLHPRTTGP